ncbi:DUF5069 domain-containing protein [bacterium]|nr:MAG: DUF5069 domain-containing protein [bacterium]
MALALRGHRQSLDPRRRALHDRRCAEGRDRRSQRGQPHAARPRNLQSVVVGPLDLTTQPPRPPREELDGLAFLPRTIDKLRATLPGGDLGAYKIPGFTGKMCELLAFEFDALRRVVEEAAEDADVVHWLREHADTSKYAAYNALVLGSVVTDENRARMLQLHPIAAQDPQLRFVVDVIAADDRITFPAAR